MKTFSCPKLQQDDKTQRERRLGTVQGCTKPDSAYVVFFQLLLYYRTYSFDYTPVFSNGLRLSCCLDVTRVNTI